MLGRLVDEGGRRGRVKAAFIGIVAVIASWGFAAPPVAAAGAKARPSPATRSQAYERDYRQCIENLRVFDYAVADYPQSEYESVPKEVVKVNDAGVISWNGEPIDLIRLNEYLNVAQTMSPEPLYMVLTEARAPSSVVRDVHTVFVVSHICPGVRMD
jgi:hypothetical protein